MAQTTPIPQMRTLKTCLDKMIEQGYVENFKAQDGGLKSLETEKVYTAHDLKVVNFYRFEGESDPGDNTILYVIETDGGTKGTLVDGYGAYASEEVSKFIVEVEKIQKVKVTDLHA